MKQIVIILAALLASQAAQAAGRTCEDKSNPGVRSEVSETSSLRTNRDPANEVDLVASQEKHGKSLTAELADITEGTSTVTIDRIGRDVPDVQSED